MIQQVHFIDVLDYNDLPAREQQSIIKLIVGGGAVSPNGLTTQLKRLSHLSVAFVQKRGQRRQAIGVAAIKGDRPDYRNAVFARAGLGAPDDSYRLELGYVAVHPDYQKKGVARQLLQNLLPLGEHRGLWASTGTPAMGLLFQEFGWLLVGDPLLSIAAPSPRTVRLFVFDPARDRRAEVRFLQPGQLFAPALQTRWSQATKVAYLRQWGMSQSAALSLVRAGRPVPGKRSLPAAALLASQH